MNGSASEICDDGVCTLNPVNQMAFIGKIVVFTINVGPPFGISFSWGELKTPISRTGLWYANNELVFMGFINQQTSLGGPTLMKIPVN